MLTKDKIAEILKKKFSVHHLEITDDSAKHADHYQGGEKEGTHFSILIVAREFEGKKSIERHRMVNSVLKNEFQRGLHALTIKALSSDEMKQSQ